MAVNTVTTSPPSVLGGTNICDLKFLTFSCEIQEIGIHDVLMRVNIDLGVGTLLPCPASKCGHYADTMLHTWRDALYVRLDLRETVWGRRGHGMNMLRTYIMFHQVCMFHAI